MIGFRERALRFVDTAKQSTLIQVYTIKSTRNNSIPERRGNNFFSLYLPKRAESLTKKGGND
jgi:hypothetical protein